MANPSSRRGRVFVFESASPPSAPLFYEQQLISFPELYRRLQSLDQDAGIRVIGRTGGKKVLVFVTRFGPKYTMMTYVMKSTKKPGVRLASQEFGSPKEVGIALRKLASGRLQAWLY